MQHLYGYYQLNLIPLYFQFVIHNQSDLQRGILSIPTYILSQVKSAVKHSDCLCTSQFLKTLLSECCNLYLPSFISAFNYSANKRQMKGKINQFSLVPALTPITQLISLQLDKCSVDLRTNVTAIHLYLSQHELSVSTQLQTEEYEEKIRA